MPHLTIYLFLNVQIIPFPNIKVTLMAEIQRIYFGSNPSHLDFVITRTIKEYMLKLSVTYLTVFHLTSKGLFRSRKNSLKFTITYAVE